jgi:hypothetical protein
MSPVSDPDLDAFLKVALPALRLRTVGEATTGFDGKGEFSPVKLGIYHLFCFSIRIGQSNPYWSVPVDLSSDGTISHIRQRQRRHLVSDRRIRETGKLKTAP